MDDSRFRQASRQAILQKSFPILPIRGCVRTVGGSLALKTTRPATESIAGLSFRMLCCCVWTDAEPKEQLSRLPQPRDRGVPRWETQKTQSAFLPLNPPMPLPAKPP